MIEASKAAMHALVDRGLAEIERLSLSDQMQLHQAAAAALETVDCEASAISAHTAHLLREAERLQLKFRELLKS